MDSRPASTSPGRSLRSPAVDHLKGLAIIFVFLIHASALKGTLVQQYLVDRAVPIFVVLFGMTSEYWWQRHAPPSFWPAARLWYRSRVTRLLVPVWATVVVWWVLQASLSSMPLTAPRFAVALALGYLPWVGIGWFVTLVVELVIVFPFVRWAAVRFGTRLTAGVGIVVLAASHVYWEALVTSMATLLLHTAPMWEFYVWIFWPAYLFAVTCGVMIARGEIRLGTEVGAISATLVAIGWLILGERLLDPIVQQIVRSLLDVPLTLALLVAMTALGRWRALAGFLERCGVTSWGLYLGQLLVHNFVHFFVVPGQSPWAYRWAYFVVLFAGAWALVAIGNALRALPVKDWLPLRARAKQRPSRGGGGSATR